MMPGHTANSKQKENDADHRSHVSGKQPTEADDTAKREANTTDSERRRRQDSEHKSQRNSRQSVNDGERLSKTDKDERMSEKQEVSRSGGSVRRRTTSSRNQNVQSQDSNKEIINNTKDEKRTTSSMNQNVQSADSKKDSIKNTQDKENKSLETAHGDSTPKSDNAGSIRLASSLERVTTGTGSLNRENFDWSNFTYKPIAYEETKSPRAVLATGPEPCSCYPRTSKQTVSSMLYDKIRCIHCNDIGQTQANVIRFDDGWEKVPETFRKESFQIRSKSLFLGYPRPQFTSVEYDDISLNATDPKSTTPQNDDSSSHLISVSRMNVRGSNSREITSQGRNSRHLTSQGRNSREITSQGRNSRHNTSQGSNSREITSQRRISRDIVSQGGNSTVTKAPSIGDISCGIPRLGYTPQPGPSDSEISEKKPVLPGNYGISSGSSQSQKLDRSSTQSGHGEILRDINTTRTFKGKYFDNVTGKTFEYEINPDYQKGTNGWKSKRELIQQKNY